MRVSRPALRAATTEHWQPTRVYYRPRCSSRVVVAHGRPPDLVPFASTTDAPTSAVQHGARRWRRLRGSGTARGRPVGCRLFVFGYASQGVRGDVGTGTAVEALQIVWPDRYHRWPWQPGAT
ncbi:DUF4262 domain-containing protein [Couchioplanes caeruleus]|uniref:DUF4262 domain-containing protein n=1 Tax=Couchioplanes caeruleus TaxID=56438 RepID=UPI0020BF8EF4|nr:DUF4262 domain-containing protein [Couchioplanes caeruleus]UQU61793.1 DUF4262 domain-containing protein [Couchioplanes caeruleus]